MNNISLESAGLEYYAHPVSGLIRFAFQVPDIYLAVENALKYGAKLVHEPIQTPWNDWNVRIELPDGLQITLFQHIEGE